MNTKAAKKQGHWSYNFDKHRYLWKADSKKVKESTEMTLIDDENELKVNLLGESSTQQEKINNRKSKQIN